MLFPRGEVNVVGVSAKYLTKTEPVLKKLVFKVEAGEKIGVVGRTGAGKTSFIKLFWRGLEICDGQLLIDGRDITKLDLKALRSEIMVVS